jgi:opacity protein-like surface antigen
VVYTSTPPTAGEPVSLKYDDVFAVRWKRGADVGLTAGYDFGWFRLEGELAQKRIKIRDHQEDDLAPQFLSELNGALNRPSAAPDPGSPGLAALTVADFQPSGTVKIGSALVNALLDVEVVKGFNVYAGAGIGRSFVRGFEDRDGARAWQQLLGARYAITDQIDLGLKYRKFRSGIVKLDHDPIVYAGNPNVVSSTVVRTTNAAVVPDIEGELRTRGVLISLVYNMR